jgi:predicted outer membrane protein
MKNLNGLVVAGLAPALTVLVAGPVRAGDKPATEDRAFLNEAASAGQSKANDELKTLAARKSIPLPSAMTDVHDHETDVEKFREQARSATDPDVKAFAAKTLPTLETHLRMAKPIAGTGAATSGALR